MQELPLFAQGGEGEFFGCGLEQDGCVVAEDAGEDLDRRLFRGWVLSERFLRRQTMTMEMGKRIQ